VQLQTTADHASSTKKRKRVSSGTKEMCFLRLSLQERPARCRKSKQKLISECKVKQLGANAVKIYQLHKRNVLNYLKSKSHVKAAGESVLYVI